MADTGALPPRQAALLAALLTGCDIRDAAKLTLVPERTAWRWLRRDDFRAALRERQDAMFASVTRRSVATMQRAMDVLASIMEDESAPAGARVTAARVIYEGTARLTELDEMLERIEELERMQRDAQHT